MQHRTWLFFHASPNFLTACRQRRRYQLCKAIRWYNDVYSYFYYSAYYFGWFYRLSSLRRCIVGTLYYHIGRYVMYLHFWLVRKCTKCTIIILFYSALREIRLEFLFLQSHTTPCIIIVHNMSNVRVVFNTIHVFSGYAWTFEMISLWHLFLCLSVFLSLSLNVCIYMESPWDYNRSLYILCYYKYSAAKRVKINITL